MCPFGFSGIQFKNYVPVWIQRFSLNPVVRFSLLLYFFFFCFHAFQGGRRQNLLFTRKMSLFTHYFSTVHALFIGSTATLPITTSFYGLSEQGMGRDCGKTLVSLFGGWKEKWKRGKSDFFLVWLVKVKEREGKINDTIFFSSISITPFLYNLKGKRERLKVNV